MRQRHRLLVCRNELRLVVCKTWRPRLLAHTKQLERHRLLVRRNELRLVVRKTWRPRLLAHTRQLKRRRQLVRRAGNRSDPAPDLPAATGGRRPTGRLPQ